MSGLERAPVLVDMDGVLADFESEVSTRMGIILPHVVRLPFSQSFYVADDYPEHKEAITDISNQPGFFAALPVAEGALEGWERILRLGFDPQICTSPIKTNPYSRAEKLGWLEEHFVPVFGKAVVDRAIVSSDKHLFNGYALIDDRPQIRQASEARWQHIIFDKPYNHGIEGPRLRGWHDANLGRLLIAAKQRYELAA